MSATSTERKIRGCSGKGVPLTQHFRRYCHASQRYVNDFGLPCRWETENHLLPGWYKAVVAGADNLRHSALPWSMSLSNRKAFRTLTETNGYYGRTPRCFLRISLRIHHNGKSTNPIDQPELSWITKSMPSPVVWSYRRDDQSPQEVVRLRLAHFGYPLVLRNHPGPLRHMCHMP